MDDALHYKSLRLIIEGFPHEGLEVRLFHLTDRRSTQVLRTLLRNVRQYITQQLALNPLFLYIYINVG